MKPAVAALAAGLLQYVVSSAAAQRAAAVCAVARFVAYAAVGAQRVCGRVKLTKVGGLLKIHQLSGQAVTTTCVQAPRPPSANAPNSTIENSIVLVLGVDQDG